MTRKMEEIVKLLDNAMANLLNGLKRDIQAVRNAIIYEYNNGLAEGFVKKLMRG